MKRYNGIEQDDEGVYYLREEVDIEIDRLNANLSDALWRLYNPHAAFLSDALRKDNCRNCVNMRPPTISHNEDRISCQYAAGWPHWSTKCEKWEKKS